MSNLRRLLLALLTIHCCTSWSAAQQIPSGTVLPVLLETTLDAQRDAAGKKVLGKIMQDVALPDGSTIRRGARITGEVIEATRVQNASPSRLAVKFDAVVVRGRVIPLVTHLRAIASVNEVFQAKLPTNAFADYGTSESDWNTVQIGGAGVYRGNGEVVRGSQVVGRATDYGAVTAKLIAAPQRGCQNDGRRQQSLWLFSPWACGAYGYPDLEIVRRGEGAPVGAIVFQSPRNVRISAGSGLLLRVNGNIPG